MRKALLFPVSVLCLAIVFTSGCASQMVWRYRVEPQSTLPVVVEKSLSVPPFADARLNQNDNCLMMYLIPLMPFGWEDLQTPEGAQMHLMTGSWMWRPNEDIAKATAEELNASRIFKEAFFTSRASEGDLVLLGTIHSTYYRSKMFSYGLSVYAPYLWLICLPVGTSHNELELSFALKDVKSDKLFWTKSYRREKGDVHILYNMQPDFLYPDLLKDILLEVVRDIRSEAETIKAKLPQPPVAPPPGQ